MNAKHKHETKTSLIPKKSLVSNEKGSKSHNLISKANSLPAKSPFAMELTNMLGHPIFQNSHENFYDCPHAFPS
jgi:hypothetical protein